MVLVPIWQEGDFGNSPTHEKIRSPYDRHRVPFFGGMEGRAGGEWARGGREGGAAAGVIRVAKIL